MSDPEKQGAQLVIRLDKSALEAMFPEGSAARVDLQAAVVNNFVQRISDHNIHEVLARHVGTLEQIVKTQAEQFREDIAKHAQTAVRNYFGNAPAWQHTTRTLSPEAKKAINESIAGSFNETVKAAIETHVDKGTVEGLVYGQVAAILGSDVTAVKSTIKGLAREAFRELMK